jgi:hypothetical protein
VAICFQQNQEFLEKLLRHWNDSKVPFAILIPFQSLTTAWFRTKWGEAGNPRFQLVIPRERGFWKAKEQRYVKVKGAVWFVCGFALPDGSDIRIV